jgi:predicted transposase YbfD/YdcC
MAAKDLALAAYFADLPDPRVDRTKRHSLLDIVTVALCAVLSGADSFEDIEAFGRERQEWLKTLLALPNGIPSHDTFNRVFAALNPKQFALCVGRWMEAVCEATGLRQVSVDGKAVRGAARSTFDGCLHLVSAWATEQGVILGQQAVADGSNEITAIPELLEVLQLRGALVTIDAAGCQKEIAQQIRSQGGHYVLAVKENQPSLHAAVQQLAAQAAQTDFAGVRCTTFESVNDGHGRHEERCVTVITDPIGLPDGWTDANAVVLVGRERTAGGKTTSSMHSYITSLRGTAKQMGRFVRRHWAIENELHWSLDVTFGEDKNRTREKHAGDNLGLVRRVAVSLFKQDPGKGSLKVKRLKAGWNPDYLLRVLRGFKGH